MLNDPIRRLGFVNRNIKTGNMAQLSRVEALINAFRVAAPQFGEGDFEIYLVVVREVGPVPLVHLPE